MDPLDVIVVGAGAAGLLAATHAAERGLKTLLLEKTPRVGTKILMSGGTRCNITHATDRRGIVQAFGSQGRFLHSALSRLGPEDVVAFVENEGVRTKTEEGGKIFPVSDKASDVLAAFMQRLNRTSCGIALNEPVLKMEREGDGFCVTTPTRSISTRKLIVTVGGQSYPGSGTTGDGYPWMKSFEHSVITPRPALTPVTSHAGWVTKLKGLTIPDTNLKLIQNQPSYSLDQLASSKPIDVRRGSLLFTHFGLSGPVAMDISRSITGHDSPSDLRIVCDFLPEQSYDDVAKEVSTMCQSDGKKQCASVVGQFLPRRLADAVLHETGIRGDMRTAEISKKDRSKIVDSIKRTVIPVSGTRGFKKAEVTAGGVSLKEVDSKTMQSRIVPNLFLAGEILDLDGPIGGYNFQAAFSTGWLAGASV